MHNATRKRATGGGRRPKYGEPLVTITIRVPQSIKRVIDAQDMGLNEAVIEMLRKSPQCVAAQRD